MNKIGRNIPCPCGSGKKYKKCCMDSDRSSNVIYAPFGGTKTEPPLLNNTKDTKEVIGDIKSNSSDEEESFITTMDKILEVIEEKDWQRAEEMLLAKLSEHDNVYLRNNLAIVLFMSGKTELSLQYLEPCLRGEKDELKGNPFTFALASRALAELGKYDYARQCLHNAIDLFDAGLELLKETAETERGNWGEYTVAIMRAAADLQDHQQVYSLYLRWKGEHLSWENRHLAAVASFNTEDFYQAALLWRSLKKELEAAGEMERVAIAAAKGVIPGFLMDYRTKPSGELDQILKKITQDYSFLNIALKDSRFLMMLLSMIFNPETDDDKSFMLVKEVVINGGEWGRYFGERLMDFSGDLNNKHLDNLKIAAAQGLVELGVYKSDEPVPIYINGKKEYVTLKKTEVLEEADVEIERAMAKATDLQNQDRIKEAIKVMEKVCQGDKFFMPAVLKLAILLRLDDRLEESEYYLRQLKAVAPDDSVVLFNLSALMLELGCQEEAEEYLESIDLTLASPEVINKLPMLKELVYSKYEQLQMPDVDEFLGIYEEKRREKIEEKTLSKDASLSRCLRNMPAGWLNLICSYLKIQPARKRKEREDQIIKKLTQPEILKRILEKRLTEEHLDILRDLLEKDGWTPLNVITRKYGTLEGEGFFWEEKQPFFPLAQLWSNGLVAVGKAIINNRRTKIVVIPKEIRETLSHYLTSEK